MFHQLQFNKRISLIIRYLIFFSFLVITGQAWSQITAGQQLVDSAGIPLDTNSKKSPPPFVFKPTLGLGVGMFSYYGDLYTRNLVSPQVSRIGYELSLSQPVTPWLKLGFYTLFGQLGANERLITRNLNFESEIRVGGLHFEYEFRHFIPAKAIAHPWITIGAESFEFLSKTDLFDANGNRYHYWSDGSIRSLDENDPNSSAAQLLQRDYTYETDVRELNLDGFGKYQERSFAIPVGIGFNMHLDEKWDARLGVTFHLSFTDYIDGVTASSSSPRTGNKRNDNFVMTAFSLRYNLTGPGKSNDENDFDDIDYYALDNWDYDKDGVIDLKDSCGNTPPGVPVDSKGCPLDNDVDLTADYRDNEMESASGVITDEFGVTLTDSIILRHYEMYMDSTGMFAKTEVIRSRYQYKPYGGDKKVYQVRIGTYKQGLPKDLLVKYLSITDIGSAQLPDSSTVYTAGKYNDVLQAELRKRQLIQQGITQAEVVYRKSDGSFQVVNDIFGTNQTKETTGQSGKTTPNDPKITNQPDTNHAVQISNETMIDTMSGKIVFRVQLGAYAQPLSENIFLDIPDLIMVRTSDGLYKYMTGSFNTFEQAAVRKAQLLVDGYTGVFIAAYQNGKRVPLADAGAEVIKPQDKTVIDQDMNENTLSNVTMKSMVNFKIQLGTFLGDPPADVLEKINTLQGVEKSTTPSGLIRYSVGNTNDYAAIQALRNELKAKGFDQVFIIATYRGESISVSEALELLR